MYCSYDAASPFGMLFYLVLIKDTVRKRIWISMLLQLKDIYCLKIQTKHKRLRFFFPLPSVGGVRMVMGPRVGET